MSFKKARTVSQARMSEVGLRGSVVLKGKEAIFVAMVLISIIPTVAAATNFSSERESHACNVVELDSGYISSSFTYSAEKTSSGDMIVDYGLTISSWESSIYKDQETYLGDEFMLPHRAFPTRAVWTERCLLRQQRSPYTNCDELEFNRRERRYNKKYTVSAFDIERNLENYPGYSVVLSYQDILAEKSGIAMSFVGEHALNKIYKSDWTAVNHSVFIRNERTRNENVLVNSSEVYRRLTLKDNKLSYVMTIELGFINEETGDIEQGITRRVYGCSKN